jgi:ribonuclease E
MLIDATHSEETRVVVLDGKRLDEYEVESTHKKQLKGNVYLAKVIRVEPSLQAAFVDYGEGRHGFLSFSEIHPDYYQIPIADREAIFAEEERLHRQRMAAEECEEVIEDSAEKTASVSFSLDKDLLKKASGDYSSKENLQLCEYASLEQAETEKVTSDVIDVQSDDTKDEVEQENNGTEAPKGAKRVIYSGIYSDAKDGDAFKEILAKGSEYAPFPATYVKPEIAGKEKSKAETVKDDDFDDLDCMARKHRAIQRRYKIQEVINNRQILLVQVVKEERGNKGAALTTYLSLAGRYCVLMPNNSRGGGVSRKITHITDRRRLKTIVNELPTEKGMSVIVRTAGAERKKSEIKRDFEYLMRLWNNIRKTTVSSSAPALIHEEASLIKRAIRDIYTKDVSEIIVEGEEEYRIAKDFMKMLTPSHAKKVQPYDSNGISLFQKNRVEAQLEAMHRPIAQLPSGGYLVIDQTEALVAIDVNSGRSTKERNVEKTALHTNLEAADEVARQLRLRDMAGLVVIDFIDMEQYKNNNAVERRMREVLKKDRARIQMAKISPFGLMELSRQRLHPSVIETSYSECPHCKGTGMIRSVESSAIFFLHILEEECGRGRYSEMTINVPTQVAIYMLNNKRDTILDMEKRYDMRIIVNGDESFLFATEHTIDRVKAPRHKVATKKEENKKQKEEKKQSPKKEKVTDKPDNRKKRRRKNTKEEDNVENTISNEPSDLQQEPEIKEEVAPQISEEVSSVIDDSESEDKSNKKGHRRTPWGRKRRYKKKDSEEDAVAAEAEEENTNADEKAEEKPKEKVAALANTNEGQVEQISVAKEKKESVIEVESFPVIEEKEPKNKKSGWWNKLVN